MHTLHQTHSAMQPWLLPCKSLVQALVQIWCNLVQNLVQNQKKGLRFARKPLKFLEPPVRLELTIC